MVEATAELLEVRCRDCGATLRLPSHRFAAVCPYCASPSVVDRPVTDDGARQERPDYILGFDVGREAARQRVEGWIARSRFFAPSAVRRAKVTEVQGIYLPAWLYGAVARSRYSASIGENYTETETYTTTDSKGNTVVRTRTVTKTEWRSLRGEHCCYLLDVLVTASQGLGNAELETIEPFDLRALRRYDAAIVAGFAAEEATLERTAGFETARDESNELVGQRLKSFLPGDSSRLEGYQTDFEEENTDLVLLPIWVFAARYEEGGEQRPLRILVNGQTGEIQGKVPRSAFKIALFVVAVLLMVALLVLVVVGIAA